MMIARALSPQRPRTAAPVDTIIIIGDDQGGQRHRRVATERHVGAGVGGPGGDLALERPRNVPDFGPFWSSARSWLYS